MLEARAIAAGLLSAGALAGMGYLGLSIARLRAFERTVRGARAGGSPPVTVLKPLHGDEPRLYEYLRSFCEQDYPEFQIVFGAADVHDPALLVAQRLQSEFPGVDIAIAAGNAQPARNPKISNLLGMIATAKHPLLIIADSDISVGQGYLRAVAGCFDRERTGAATCIFSGAPNESLASRIGAMAINDHFIPSVLVAAALEPLAWCVGATVAVRAAILEEIGGLRAIGEHLADDYEIGRRVRAAGYEVALVPYVVRTGVPERALLPLWRHEVRWARTVRASRPAGYAGYVIANPLPLAFLAAVCAGFSAPSTLLLAATAAARLAVHFQACRTLAPAPPPNPVLIPVRDGLSLAVWFAAFLGRRVRWRGTTYSVDADGRLPGGTGTL